MVGEGRWFICSSKSQVEGECVTTNEITSVMGSKFFDIPITF